MRQGKGQGLELTVADWLSLLCQVDFLSDLSFPTSKRDNGGLWFWMSVFVQLMVVIWSPNIPLGVSGRSCRILPGCKIQLGETPEFELILSMGRSQWRMWRGKEVRADLRLNVEVNWLRGTQVKRRPKGNPSPYSPDAVWALC